MLRLLDLRRIDDALPVFVRPACGAYVDLRLFSHLRRRLAQPHERFAHGPNPLIQPEDCGTWPCITRGCDIPHRTPPCRGISTSEIKFILSGSRNDRLKRGAGAKSYHRDNPGPAVAICAREAGSAMSADEVSRSSTRSSTRTAGPRMCGCT